MVDQINMTGEVDEDHDDEEVIQPQVASPSPSEGSPAPLPVASVPQDQGIQMFPDGAPSKPPLSEGAAVNRANKTDFALQEQSPGSQDLHNQIVSGNETSSREAAAANADEIDWIKRTQLINKLWDRAKVTGQTELDQRDLDIISGLSKADYKNNAKTIWEQKFADSIAKATKSGVYGEKEDLDTIHGTGVGLRFLTNQQIAINIKENLDAEIAQMGYLDRGITELGALLVPATWWTTQNALKGVKTPNSFLAGSNVRDQIDAYYRMTPAEAEKNLTATIEEMKKMSPRIAADYLSHFSNFSTANEILANVGGIAEPLMMFPTPIKTGKNVVKAFGDIAEAVAAGKSWRITDTLAAGGDTVAAAHQSIVSGLRETAAKDGPESAKGVEELFSTLSRFANPDHLLEGGNNSSAATRRLLVEHEANASKNLIDAVFRDTTPIARIQPGTPQAAAAAEEALARMRVQYPGMDNTMIDSAFRHQETNNAMYLDIKLGDTSGRYFVDKETAEAAASQMYGIRNADVRQQGNSWYIHTTTPIDETSGAIRAVQLTPDQETPQSLTNTILGTLRKADSLRGKDLNIDTALAQYGSGQLRTALEEAAKPISDLWHKERGRLSTFLENERTAPNPTGVGPPGRFQRTIGQLEEAWFNTHKQAPTPREMNAYFAFTRISDIDWMVRTLSTNTRDSRAGLQQFGLQLGKDYLPPTIKARTMTPERMVAMLDDNIGSNIIVWDGDAQRAAQSFSQTKFMRGEANAARDEALQLGQAQQQINSALTGTGRVAELPRQQPYTKTQMREMIRSGEYKIIQMTDDGHNAFMRMPGVGDAFAEVPGRVNYILTKEHEIGALPFNQLPYRPGGHMEYNEGFFAGQAAITRSGGSHIYTGDTNAFHHTSERGIRLIAEQMEQIRVLRNAGDDAALRAYLRTTPHRPADVERMFKPVAEGGAGFDPNQPFRYRAKGQTFGDRYNLKQEFRDFVDERYSPHNPYNGTTQVAYSGEREAPLMTYDAGHIQGVSQPFRQAELLDPVSTMNRGASQILTDKYLGDLKTKYAERFLADHGHLLDASLEEIRTNPVRALFETPIRKDLNYTEEGVAARMFRQTTKNFFGVKSDMNKALESQAANMMANFTEAHPIAGRAAQAGIDWVDWIALGAVKNPAHAMRQFAFHEKLGLFNPVQLPLQAMQFTNVIAIEGFANGSRGAAAYTLQRAMSMAPQAVEMLAKKAESIGWKAEHLIEATREMEKIGFHNSKYNSNLLSDYLEGKMIRSKGSQFLEAGTVFFNEGERIARSTSWNSAYLRWREMNPNAAFNGNAVKEVLARAELTNFNMSRNSNAMWQRGLLAVPTQFFSYQARITEAMFSGGLSGSEKLRLGLTNFGMYGIPGAIALGAGAIDFMPYSESIKKAGNEILGELPSNAIGDALKKGLPSLLGKMVTGEEYNFADRYGLNGLKAVVDLKENRKGWLETMLGASGNIISKNWKDGNALAWEVIKHYREDGHEMHPQDYFDVLKNISTLSNLDRGAKAYNLGRYYTQNQNMTAKKEPQEFSRFIASTLLGLQPQEIMDGWGSTPPTGGVKDPKFAMKQEAEKWYSIAYQNQAMGDDTNADIASKRAYLTMVAGGFTEDEIQKHGIEVIKKQDMTVFEKIAVRAQEKAEKASKKQEKLMNEQAKRNRQLAEEAAKRAGATR